MKQKIIQISALLIISLLAGVAGAEDTSNSVIIDDNTNPVDIIGAIGDVNAGADVAPSSDSNYPDGIGTDGTALEDIVGDADADTALEDIVGDADAGTALEDIVGDADAGTALEDIVGDADDDANPAGTIPTD